jgi:hypothetical protein
LASTRSMIAGGVGFSAETAGLAAGQVTPE